jgi:hypothetical protein
MRFLGSGCLPPFSTVSQVARGRSPTSLDIKCWWRQTTSTPINHCEGQDTNEKGILTTRNGDPMFFFWHCHTSQCPNWPLMTSDQPWQLQWVDVVCIQTLTTAAIDLNEEHNICSRRQNQQWGSEFVTEIFAKRLALEWNHDSNRTKRRTEPVLRPVQTWMALKDVNNFDISPYRFLHCFPSTAHLSALWSWSHSQQTQNPKMRRNVDVVDTLPQSHASHA